MTTSSTQSPPNPTADALDRVLGAPLADAVSPLRSARPAVAEHTQRLHDAFFGAPSPNRERLAAIALRVTVLAAQPTLVEHYSALLPPDLVASVTAGTVADPELAALLRHAELLTLDPAAATREAIGGLRSAGLTEAAIVTASQLIGYVNYQIRLVAGYTLIGESA
ncbi:CMD domain-containing protein [Rhodococcus oryzae]|uniref:CMD domain-containing protein n=1 Tax=Rhodococcus oryzae TaxID=2571143 RepID=UPI0037185EB3